MQTLNQINNLEEPFSAVGRSLTAAEIEAVGGGSQELNIGGAISLVIGGAALAASAPAIAGVLVLGSIGLSGLSIWQSLMRS